jgi:branched-chain amino acid transport system ATP-binding protein
MFSHLTVAENVRASIPPGADPAERMQRAFDRFPDLEGLRGQEAGSLSGGQQQMLAIARALVGDNDVLLVDEPSEGLAPLIVEEVVEALEDLPDEQTLVLVEQNVPMALALTDRFYVLDHGEVVAEGDSADASLEDDRIRRYLTA